VAYESVTSVYEAAKTAVQTDDGFSEWFDIKVGLHQGPALILLLLIRVMEVVSREIRGGLPWELLNVDDVVPLVEL
jgi:hypothetical protein